MRYDIVKNPVGMVDFVMDWNDKVTAEAGAMVYINSSKSDQCSYYSYSA